MTRLFPLLPLHLSYPLIILPPQQLHSVLSNLGLFMMLGGLYAIYANKERMGKQHWTTWHAYAGLLTLALWAANIIVAGANTNDFAKGRFFFLWRSRSHR